MHRLWWAICGECGHPLRVNAASPDTREGALRDADDCEHGCRGYKIAVFVNDGAHISIIEGGYQARTPGDLAQSWLGSPTTIL